jgi:hypothetical protein
MTTLTPGVPEHRPPFRHRLFDIAKAILVATIAKVIAIIITGRDVH